MEYVIIESRFACYLVSITQKNKVCQVYLNLLAYGKFGTNYMPRY